MTEVTIKLIGAEDATMMDAAFELFRDNIETSEQRPEAEFRALAGRPDYRVLAALMYGELIGMAVAWVPQGAPIWLFEYAAVAPELRGSGVGSNLFAAARHLAGQKRLALVEVDALNGRDEQARRLTFYRRLGCKRVADLQYLLPLEAFGKPPPMWLLALPPTEMAKVSVFDVESWLRGIYSEVYGKKMDDPRLAAMIDPLPDEVGLVGI